MIGKETSTRAQRIYAYWTKEDCAPAPPAPDLSSAPPALAALYALANGVELDPYMISFHRLASWRPLNEGSDWVCFADWADRGHLYAFQGGPAGARVAAFGLTGEMFREWPSVDSFLESYLERPEELIDTGVSRGS